MTRINVIPVEQLTREHLLGENKEITRVFGLVKKAQERGINKYNKQSKLDIPSEYTMGKGHVTFFYDKLGYVVERYEQLTNELRKRGYSPSPIDREELLKGINKEWLGQYTPTEKAIQINLERINKRLSGDKT